MTHDNVLLSTTYFGPVQWYQKLHRYRHVWMERCESFIKQTYRNRCVIAAAHGPQTLSIPIVHGATLTRDIRISDHGEWRHLHWNAIRSAYGESPFFEFYADDLEPFFTRRWDFLIDFNDAITAKMCELLDITPHILPTERYSEKSESTGKAEDTQDPERHETPDSPMRTDYPAFSDDYREAIRPKHPLPDPDFTPKRYYQVFEQRHGFLPNLSILDLLMNEGNESVLYL